MSLLFRVSEKREFIISDVYVMALTFILVYLASKSLRAFTKKKLAAIQKQKRQINIPNPKGGALISEWVDDAELSKAILTCIEDSGLYFVKDKRIIKIIFKMVKAKIQNESLQLTPNMVRFLAKMILRDQPEKKFPTLLKVGNFILSTESRARLKLRIIGTAVIASIAGFVQTALPHFVFLTLVYFYSTEDCYQPCHNYFEELPNNEEAHQVFVEEPTGQLLIGGNDEAHQVEISVPSVDKVSSSTNTNKNVAPKTIQRSYSKARKQARQVNFSDFRKTDPVLSAFDNLEEPLVEQTPCKAPLLEAAMDALPLE